MHNKQLICKRSLTLPSPTACALAVAQVEGSEIGYKKKLPDIADSFHFYSSFD
jgi:hypothetical protein